MKKLYTLVALLTISSIATFAQDCKYDKNEVDEFTKKSIKTTEEHTIANGNIGGRWQQFNLYLSVIDGIKLLSIVHTDRHSSVVSAWCVNESTPIIFLLEDGSTVELSHFGETSCAKGGARIVGNVNVVDYRLITSYTLTDDIIKRLKTSPIKKVRMNTQQSHKEFEIKEKVKKPLGSFATKNANKKINPKNYFIDYLDCIK